MKVRMVLLEVTWGSNSKNAYPFLIGSYSESFQERKYA